MSDVNIDESTVRRFMARLHAVAAGALAWLPDPGRLQLSFLSPRTDKASMQWIRWDVGDHEGMADAAIKAARDGLNVYVEGRTVDRRAKGRGAACTTVGVFALIDDSDADTGKPGGLALLPSLVVETSPGNFHNWLLLDQGLTAEQAEPIGRAMRAAVGSDSATAKVTQPYRVPGTPNHPSPRKRQRGRVTVSTSLLIADGPVYAADALRASFPSVALPSPATNTARAASEPMGATLEGMAAAAVDDRSAQLFRIVLRACQDGGTPGDVEALLRRHPTGCAGKYLTPDDRLAGEVARAWTRAEALLAFAPCDPTYPDATVDVADARAALLEAIQYHFTAGPGCRAVPTGTGIGKTTITTMVLAREIQARRAVGEGVSQSLQSVANCPTSFRILRFVNS